MKITQKQFNEGIEKIAKEIEGSGERYGLIIAPVRGGLIPGTVLSHRLNLPLFPLQWSYRDTPWLNNIPDVLRVNVGHPHFKGLIVEDIVDSGKTVDFLVNELGRHSSMGAKWFDIAALVANVSAPVQTRYTYKTIDRKDDDSWVEFWWEHSEK